MVLFLGEEKDVVCPYPPQAKKADKSTVAKGKNAKKKVFRGIKVKTSGKLKKADNAKLNKKRAQQEEEGATGDAFFFQKSSPLPTSPLPMSARFLTILWRPFPARQSYLSAPDK